MISRRTFDKNLKGIAATASVAWIVLSSALQSQTVVVPDTTTSKPRLAVIMFVDQMRADYLTRWTSLYTGGLRRLCTQGAVFTNARHDHATTQTAVGHATISTGTTPARHGIVGNSFYDRHSGKVINATTDAETQLVGGTEGTGASSKYLLRPALGDWIKTQSSETRVFAASLKDRAAVLTGGLSPNGVYWYESSTGNFVTSTYYAQELPLWATQFNQSGVKDTWKDSIWIKTDSALTYQGDDGVPVEYDGVHNMFPHAVRDLVESTDTNYYYDALYETPFADAMLLRFCSELVLHEQLGADSVPDILFMSLSAADLIGHSFGPDSHEIQDYYLRLDKYLVPFLKMLDANVGAGKYLFVLTADHGVCPLPEVEAARGNTAARRLRSNVYHSDVRSAIARAFPDCQKPESLITFFGPSIIINEPYAAACSLKTELTRFRIAAAVQRVGYVADVFTFDQLASDTVDFRPCAQQFKNSFRPDRSPDLFVNFYEWILVTGSSFGTSHGTPYHYDTDVPLVFFGDGVEAEIYEDPARTVDIAPTVTALLGLTPPPDLDGQVLRIAR